MIQIQQLGLQRGGHTLFSDVDLTLFPGWKVGLTGRNGCGKSSLFAVMRGQLEVDAGRLEYPAQWVVTAVEQDTPALPRIAIEHVLDGDQRLRGIEAELARAEDAEDHNRAAELHGDLESAGAFSARARAARMLHGLGFSEADQQRAVAEFSGGWRMRLNLARALIGHSDLLLLDEPTNHLDVDAILWLESWLRDTDTTVVMISHDREFLDAVIDHVAHIEHQGMRLYNGNYSEFERQRAERLAVEQSQRQKQMEQRSKMEAFVARFRAQATKARQAQSRLKMLSRMAELPPLRQEAPMHLSFDCSDAPGNPMLSLQETSAGYGETEILQGLQLAIPPGARLGLLGRNGAGKSTLMKLLAGELKPMSGQRIEAPGLRIGYFAQHQIDRLDPDRSPLSMLGDLAPESGEQALRNYLGRFAISGDFATQPVGNRSGGERSRVALALVAWHRPHVLLLDEPTNHLDLATREALADGLQEYDGALVLVSHDRHLLRLVCDELLVVHDGELSPYEGDLDDYGQWLRQRLKAANASKPKALKAVPRTDSPEHKRTQNRLRNEGQKLEQRITRTSERLAELEGKLADSSLYTEANETQRQQLIAEHAKVQSQLETLEEAWLQNQDAQEALAC